MQLAIFIPSGPLNWELFRGIGVKMYHEAYAYVGKHDRWRMCENEAEGFFLYLPWFGQSSLSDSIPQ